MTNRLFPGFDTAGPNANLITAPELPTTPVVQTVSGNHVKLSGVEQATLTLARNIASFIAPMEIAYDPDTPLPTGWDELRDQTQQLYDDFSAPYGRWLPVKTASDEPYERYKLLHASLSGTTIMMAIAEVIPRLCFREEFADPNAQLAEIARRSTGLVIGWMAVHPEVDADLDYGLAAPKPQLDKPYEQLRYHTKWFSFLSDAVGLRPDKVADLEGEPRRCPASQSQKEIRRHPNRIIRPDMILFGCPARKHVPRLFRAMVNRAEQAELFAATYHATRQAHGYVIQA